MNQYTFSYNLAKTPITDAYKYETYSEFIKRMRVPKFSPVCVFCSSSKTDSLVNDGGSFRRCANCRKDFKAVIIN
jgi:transposase-like protein